MFKNNLLQIPLNTYHVMVWWTPTFLIIHAHRACFFKIKDLCHNLNSADYMIHWSFSCMIWICSILQKIELLLQLVLHGGRECQMGFKFTPKYLAFSCLVEFPALNFAILAANACVHPSKRIHTKIACYTQMEMMRR